jgi:hypothetical protein
MSSEDYTIKEFHDGRKPSHQVIARIEPASQDGVSHPELARALITTGAVKKVRELEFLTTDDGVSVVFWLRTPSREEIYMRIQEAQGLFTAGIGHALGLQRFIKALDLTSSRKKR